MTMYSLRERRRFIAVLGSLALMLSVLAATAPALADPPPQNIQFEFVFENGSVWSGSNQSVVDENGEQPNNQNDIPVLQVNGFPGPDFPGEVLHVSCSESFTGGFAGTTWPNSSEHSTWKIASYEITRNGAPHCGETLVPGSITVVKTTDPETSDTFDFGLTGTEIPCGSAAPSGATGCGGSVDDTQAVAGNGGDYTWDVNAGDYSLEELVGNNPAGYELEMASCVSSMGGDPFSPGNFEVVGAEDVTCSFHNTAEAPPPPPPPTETLVAITIGVCEWDGQTSTTNVSVNAGEGATVTLKNASDQEVAPGDLGPGDYTWTVTVAEGYTLTDTTVNGVSQDDDTMGEFTAVDCEPPPPPPPPELCALGDLVWWDLNENGLQDANEPPVEGAVVTLWTYDGDTEVQVDSMVTGADGQYFFDDLDCGTYFVTFDVSNVTIPPPFTDPDIDWTDQGDGSNPASDSNADANGRTGDVVLIDGTTDVDTDAGLTIVDVLPTTVEKLPETGYDYDITAAIALLMLVTGAFLVTLTGRREEGTA